MKLYLILQLILNLILQLNVNSYLISTGLVTDTIWINSDPQVHTICLYQHCQNWSQTLLASVPLRRQIQGGKKQRKEERKQAAEAEVSSRSSGGGEVVEVER